jgi:hypothetical protein
MVMAVLVASRYTEIWSRVPLAVAVYRNASAVPGSEESPEPPLSELPTSLVDISPPI